MYGLNEVFSPSASVINGNMLNPLYKIDYGFVWPFLMQLRNLGVTKFSFVLFIFCVVSFVCSLTLAWMDRVAEKQEKSLKLESAFSQET